ncbi:MULTISPECIES: glucans biosynthesis glucosyltransferase MdoH [unclassified Polaromonas]|jgi:membrane glycosyltransferase|uniref:glucans biosynthesis glucosyltransferase MdoH n=1 Tax=unclassified Polaromonas TaxID=2638319 RepID=UPI000BCDE398|nr:MULTISPECIES: glucans biosynthesis glucosyltransferase MdoH [unclassified Polaromonas]OYY36441.1 MAG: glucan biosynthesis glucosyltransferase H [Polaromonas sp. 35-63-35]OYZ22676.1 MAG: glucan biosynthesis glucosyltransferase H [Polaromonas sp. 16-63-31]OYZ81111.1 MAG: glucan biosynthesis glucosyltransferase H [Polaromonas sp. 24-63-21]OZA52670.1 MAG: glucan biosynthesis glucosyltransferase H [Polaromonas sp. 17-63-33]OZA88475.1 MAG: glucan biosynthesis glucosyltransferase H [Polaromonas sp
MDQPDHTLTPRSLLREERHPNSVTAPPLHRGSMVPRPWRGFWNSLGTAALGLARSRPAHPAPLPARAPWQQAAARRRAVFVLLTVLSTVLATSLFADMQPDYDSAWLQYGQLVLFALLSAWVVTGFMTAMMGFYVTIRGDKHALSAKNVQHHALDDATRTAIIMPICNEDVRTVFAGLRATCESVAATGHVKAFDVFVLSDTSNPATQKAERAAWEELRTQLAAQPDQPRIEVYYRLRKRRTDRKAGNVADFCRRWGKDYRYMVVLDADSVMSGDCLVAMVKLMEANPTAGIIQTATQAIGHVTLHARAQQFASRVTGRLFTLGMQFWQMGESHYWGHNAIIRIEPFMQHCALAHIKGTGGMSGSIMSHDFVEAALMRRAGYHVWLVADLVGSYEQQPPDLLAELQRDRRWCQGNLQNSRLIAEPGIHPVHRSMFGTGAMAYLSAPLWLCFLTLGTALWLSGTPMVSDWTLLPGELLTLWAWTLSMLFLPRLLGIAAVLINRQQQAYGGTASLLRSALLETLIALLQAPIRMLAHSLFVLVALTGLKLEWKSPPREAAAVPWRIALQQLAPMSAVIVLLAAGITLIDASALVWLLPVGLPLLLAIPMTVLTSKVGVGTAMRTNNYLLIPEETKSPAVLRRAWMHASQQVRPRLRAI